MKLLSRIILIFDRCVVLLFVAVAFATATMRVAAQVPVPAPIDPQKVQDQDDMTWDDYHPIPGKNWADPSLVPERKFRMALVAIDFPDQPFVITYPKKSEIFGNPQIDAVSREKVAQFYADFFNKPSEVNHGHTINGYWMEQSRGKFGIVSLEAFGPYRMPRPLWAYGLNEHRQNNSSPTGEPANSRMEPDVDALWTEATGKSRRDYDAVLRLYAGYDETSVWQEFGEMKFKSRDDIPPEWGNPDPGKPRWVPTRYVPWTSWRAGMQQWGLSSIRQGESSGTITHELGHSAFGIGDLNNNPYVQPYRRVAVGPWDMMDRGSFNGPGGPHMRWVVPPTQGAAMPAGLMLRNKLQNKFITDEQVLRLNRDGLAKSGLAVAKIIARAVEPGPDSFAGLMVRFDGAEPQDHTPSDDPNTNPLSAGTPNFNFYSLEVIQRIGYDSFCPDNGVLIAKNKDRESRNSGSNGFNGFIWVIDAHPEDIKMVDYKKPGTGEPVMRTVADYRQLNDALFHAGLNSGSQCETEDSANRLHFYVIDIQHDAQGVLAYTVGVRSLDGAGPQTRGVSLAASGDQIVSGLYANCNFKLANTGKAAETEPSPHPQNAAAYLNNDIYRLSVSVIGQGWTAQLPNALAAVKFGESVSVPVRVTQTQKVSPIHFRAPRDLATLTANRKTGNSPTALVTLKAVSESDPSKSASAACTVSAP